MSNNPTRTRFSRTLSGLPLVNRCGIHHLNKIVPVTCLELKAKRWHGLQCRANFVTRNIAPMLHFGHACINIITKGIVYKANGVQSIKFCLVSRFFSFGGGIGRARQGSRSANHSKAITNEELPIGALRCFYHALIMTTH